MHDGEYDDQTCHLRILHDAFTDKLTRTDKLTSILCLILPGSGRAMRKPDCRPTGFSAAQRTRVEVEAFVWMREYKDFLF
jgi:hypothetical protein